MWAASIQSSEADVNELHPLISHWATRKLLEWPQLWHLLAQYTRQLVEPDKLH